MTKVLVTGAGGFIEHHLVCYLKGFGYWVRGVDVKYPAKLTGNHQIEIGGDGEQTRSFCYIEDCAKGIYKLIQPDSASMSWPISLSEMAGFQVTKKHVPVHRESEAGIRIITFLGKCWAGSPKSHLKKGWRTPMRGSETRFAVRLVSGRLLGEWQAKTHSKTDYNTETLKSNFKSFPVAFPLLEKRLPVVW